MEKRNLVLWALLGLSLIAFGVSLGGDWVYDDIPLIAENAKLHSLGSSTVPELFRGHMWEGAARRASSAYFRPLLLLSYALDWRVGGGAPWSFHVTNLVLHGTVVWLLVRRLSGSGASPIAVFLAAAWFALHPARAESVSWISGRPDLLAALGFLLASEASERGGAGQVLLLVLGGVVAMGAKETGALFPLGIFLGLGGASAFTSERRRALLIALPLAVVYVCFRVAFVPLATVGAPPPWPTRALLVLETLGRFTTVLVAPSDLSLLGSTPAVTGDGYEIRWFFVAVAVIVLAGVAALLAARSVPVRIKVPVLLALAVLAPNLNIVWSGLSYLMAPRFLYVPSLFLADALASALVVIPLARIKRPIVVLVAALPLGLCLWSAIRSLDFVNNNAFWQAEIAQNPGTPDAMSFRARAAVGEGRLEEGIAVATCAFARNQKKYVRSNENAQLLVDVLGPASAAVPDLNQVALDRLRVFVANLRVPRRGAELTQPFFVQVSPTGKFKREFQFLDGPLALLEAEISLRLGRVDEARRLLRESYRVLPNGMGQRMRLARVALRAGDFRLVREVLPENAPSFSGPLSRDAAIARAQELAEVARGEGEEAVVAGLLGALERGLPGKARHLAMSHFGPDLEHLPKDPALAVLVRDAFSLAGDSATSERLTKRFGLGPAAELPTFEPTRVESYSRRLDENCSL